MWQLVGHWCKRFCHTTHLSRLYVSHSQNYVLKYHGYTKVSKNLVCLGCTHWAMFSGHSGDVYQYLCYAVSNPSISTCRFRRTLQMEHAQLEYNAQNFLERCDMNGKMRTFQMIGSVTRVVLPKRFFIYRIQISQTFLCGVNFTYFYQSWRCAHKDRANWLYCVIFCQWPIKVAICNFR